MLEQNRFSTSRASLLWRAQARPLRCQDRALRKRNPSGVASPWVEWFSQRLQTFWSRFFCAVEPRSTRAPMRLTSRARGRRPHVRRTLRPGSWVRNSYCRRSTAGNHCNCSSGIDILNPYQLGRGRWEVEEIGQLKIWGAALAVLPAGEADGVARPSSLSVGVSGQPMAPLPFQPDPRRG